MSPPLVALLTGGRSGGAFGRIPRWLAHGFRENGVRFDAVYLDGPPGVETDGSTREVKLGTERATRSIGAWARYLAEERPRLALASPESLAPYALLAARRGRGAAVVPWETSFVTFGMHDFPLARRLTLPTMQRWTYRRAPWVAAVSHDVAHELNERLSGGARPDRYRVLPNPFMPDPHEGTAPQVTEGRFRFCAVGRLTVHKGFDVLFEATARLVREGRDVEVLLVGDGPRRDDLEGLAARLDLRDRINFVGAIRHPIATMKAAHALVHPARREGFGLVIVEALAAGVPVIATSCPGGPKDILDGGRYGALVMPDDAGALAAEMARFQDDDGLRARLARAGRERVEVYRPESVAELLAGMAA